MIILCFMIFNNYILTQKEFFETSDEDEDEDVDEDEEYENQDDKEEKKRIAILISGQTRSNSLGYDTSNQPF